MSVPLFGRVVGETIELEAAVPDLDGKRVRLTVEVVETNEHPAARAWREAPADDGAITSEERASIEAAKRSARWHTPRCVRNWRRAIAHPPGDDEEFAATGRGFLRVLIDGSGERRLYVAGYCVHMGLDGATFRVMRVIVSR